jgi:hypothetical protein
MIPLTHGHNLTAADAGKTHECVAKPLLLHANLPSSMWGHVVLHAAALLRLRPTLLNTQTPYELLTGRPPISLISAPLSARYGCLYLNLNDVRLDLSAKRASTLGSIHPLSSDT